MTIKDQLITNMKQALKAKQTDRLGIIRYALSEIKNAEIDQGELDDAGVQAVLAKLVKQLKDAIAEFQRGGRDDIVAAEQAKVEVLEEYLPEQLSDQQLTQIIDEVIAGLTQPSMGQVMNQVMTRVAGRADGSKVAQLVKTRLN